MSVLERLLESFCETWGGLGRLLEGSARSVFARVEHVAKIMPKMCQKVSKKSAKKLSKSRFLEEKLVQEAI